MAERNLYPSEKQDRLIVRFPDGMRDQIARLAKANNRSMNAEVVSYVERGLASKDPAANGLVATPDIVRLLEEMRGQLKDATGNAAIAAEVAVDTHMAITEVLTEIRALKSEVSKLSVCNAPRQSAKKPK
jgi:hypothetical protein